MIHFAAWAKKEDIEFDDFIIKFLKPALSGWDKLESGDAILSGSDVIGYANASCKSFSFAAITPNAYLSSFLFFSWFDSDIGSNIDFSPSTNLSFTKCKYFSLTSTEACGRSWTTKKINFLTSTYPNCWTIFKMAYLFIMFLVHSFIAICCFFILAQFT